MNCEISSKAIAQVLIAPLLAIAHFEIDGRAFPDDGSTVRVSQEGRR
jgi:hypothetical protein